MTTDHVFPVHRATLVPCAYVRKKYQQWDRKIDNNETVRVVLDFDLSPGEFSSHCDMAAPGIFIKQFDSRKSAKTRKQRVIWEHVDRCLKGEDGEVRYLYLPPYLTDGAGIVYSLTEKKSRRKIELQLVGTQEQQKALVPILLSISEDLEPWSVLASPFGARFVRQMTIIDQFRATDFWPQELCDEAFEIVERARTWRHVLKLERADGQFYRAFRYLVQPEDRIREEELAIVSMHWTRSVYKHMTGQLDKEFEPLGILDAHDPFHKPRDVPCGYEMIPVNNSDDESYPQTILSHDELRQIRGNNPRDDAFSHKIKFPETFPKRKDPSDLQNQLNFQREKLRKPVTISGQDAMSNFAVGLGIGCYKAPEVSDPIDRSQPPPEPDEESASSYESSSSSGESEKSRSAEREPFEPTEEQIELARTHGFEFDYEERVFKESGIGMRGEGNEETEKMLHVEEAEEEEVEDEGPEIKWDDFTEAEKFREHRRLKKESILEQRFKGREKYLGHKDVEQCKPPYRIKVKRLPEFKRFCESSDDDDPTKIRRGRFRIPWSQRVGKTKLEPDEDLCQPYFVDGVSHFKAQHNWQGDENEDKGAAMAFWASISGFQMVSQDPKKKYRSDEYIAPQPLIEEPLDIGELDVAAAKMEGLEKSYGTYIGHLMKTNIDSKPTLNDFAKSSQVLGKIIDKNKVANYLHQLRHKEEERSAEAELKEDFDDFDLNRDGFVDSGEVRTLLTKQENDASAVEGHVVDFFLQADSDYSGTVSMDEYLAYSRSFVPVSA
eukprot:gene1333-378_t